MKMKGAISTLQALIPSSVFGPVVYRLDGATVKMVWPSRPFGLENIEYELLPILSEEEFLVAYPFALKIIDASL